MAEFRLLILLLLLSVRAQLFFELANPIRISFEFWIDGWMATKSNGR